MLWSALVGRRLHEQGYEARGIDGLAPDLGREDTTVNKAERLYVIRHTGSLDREKVLRLAKGGWQALGSMWHMRLG